MSGCPVRPATNSGRPEEVDDVANRILDRHFICRDLVDAVAKCRTSVVQNAPKSDSGVDRFVGQITAALRLRRTNCEPEVKKLVACRSEMGYVAAKVEDECGAILSPAGLSMFFDKCVAKQRRKYWLWADNAAVNEICVEELRKFHGCAAEVHDKALKDRAKSAE